MLQDSPARTEDPHGDVAGALEEARAETVRARELGDISATLDLTPAQVEDLGRERFYVQLHSEKAPDGNLWGWLLVQENKR